MYLVCILILEGFFQTYLKVQLLSEHSFWHENYEILKSGELYLEIFEYCWYFVGVKRLINLLEIIIDLL